MLHIEDTHLAPFSHTASHAPFSPAYNAKSVGQARSGTIGHDRAQIAGNERAIGLIWPDHTASHAPFSPAYNAKSVGQARSGPIGHRSRAIGLIWPDHTASHAPFSRDYTDTPKEVNIFM